MALLDIKRLSIEIPTERGMLQAVRDVSITLEPGQCLGIVGESGSGKSLTALSIVNLIPRTARRYADRLMLNGVDLLSMGPAQMAKNICGREVGFIFQEPMSSLNPVYTIGRQLTECMTNHGTVGVQQARRRAIDLLERVRIPDAEKRLASFPHELSGGQRQRVMIAMALMNEPRLLIADEPTTALDVTVQAEIVSLLGELRRDMNMGMLFISHNLAVIDEVADNVSVMYAGEVVEEAATSRLFSDPRHPYTQSLMQAIPRIGASGRRLKSIPGSAPSFHMSPDICVFAGRCPIEQPDCRKIHPQMRYAGTGHRHRCITSAEAKISDVLEDNIVHRVPASELLLTATNLSRTYAVRSGLLGRKNRIMAVKDVSLQLRRGETLALVGESGCGKSSLARLLLGLEQPDQGEIVLGGERLNDLQPRARAKRLQIVFQDPQGSLNPARTIREIVRRPLDLLGNRSPAERTERVNWLLDRIGLPDRLHDAVPRQLSGGQRQRVAIARALASGSADVVVCDEPTSALDVSVQAQILNMLSELREEMGLSLLFISHDLNVVGYMADRIAVMYQGQIVEQGTALDIMTRAEHPYTRRLLAASPRPAWLAHAN